jgi:hypothetical protein
MALISLEESVNGGVKQRSCDETDISAMGQEARHRMIV